jgi:hypothetical protein
VGGEGVGDCEGGWPSPETTSCIIWNIGILE